MRPRNEVVLVWRGDESYSFTYGPLTPGKTTITVSASEVERFLENGWQRTTTDTKES